MPNDANFMFSFLVIAILLCTVVILVLVCVHLGDGLYNSYINRKWLKQRNEINTNSFEARIADVKRWAVERGIDTCPPHRQLDKLEEEVGELVVAETTEDMDMIIDSVGDITVVLIVYCLQRGLDYKSCLDAAYNEIKDRKGKLINGTFVKEADLNGKH